MRSALARMDRFGPTVMVDGERFHARPACIGFRRASGGHGFCSFLWPARPEDSQCSIGCPAIGGVGRQRASHRHEPEGPAHLDAHAARFREFQRVRHPMLRLAAAYRAPCSVGIGAQCRDTGCSGQPLQAAAWAGCQTVGHGSSGFRGVSERASERADQPAHACRTGPPRLALLHAAAQAALPQRIFREPEAEVELAQLSRGLGQDVPAYSAETDLIPIGTELVQDAALQKAVFEAYRKDFVQFGFTQAPHAT
jgi:hypothetical protein